MQRLRGAGRDEARQVVPGADRLELGRTRRDHDLVGVDVEHPVPRPGDDRGAGIDRDDLVTGAGVEDDDGSAGGSRSASAASSPADPPPTTATSTSRRRTSIATPAGVDPRSGRSTTGSGGMSSAGWRTTAIPGRAGAWHVRTYVMPSTWARQLPQSPARHSVPPCPGTIAGAQDRDRHGITRLEGDRPPVDDDPAARHGRRAGVGHWRIREPVGSNSGSGWSRAGRRRPMISISNPAPPGPSGDASAVGT